MITMAGERELARSARTASPYKTFSLSHNAQAKAGHKVTLGECNTTRCRVLIGSRRKTERGVVSR